MAAHSTDYRRSLHRSLALYYRSLHQFTQPELETARALGQTASRRATAAELARTNSR